MGKAVRTVNPDYSRKLGKRVQELRLARGLTQEQLAARLQVCGSDLTRSALAKVECAQRHLYPDELRALTLALHVSWEELMPE